MANLIDDLESSITSLLSAYTAASAVLDDTAHAQLARATLAAMEPIARDVSGTDFAYQLNTLGTGSVADLQVNLPSGTGDY